MRYQTYALVLMVGRLVCLVLNIPATGAFCGVTLMVQPPQFQSQRDKFPTLLSAVSFRSATVNDVFMARKTLFQEAMNPLSLTQENLLVAFDDELPDDTSLLGFGQIRPLDSLFAELASLYVVPEERGRGIGSAIVEQLLKKHDEVDDGTTVCLLTLESTTNFYARFGFQEVSDDELKSSMPSSLRFEYSAGTVVSTFLGNGLVCMKRLKATSS